MKRAKYILLLVLTILTVRIYGDVILVEHKYPLSRVFVKIGNLNEYPDIEIVGLSKSLALFSKMEAYVFDSTSCVEVHSASPLTFYAVKKDYLKKNKIKNITWEEDENVRKCNGVVDAKNIHTTNPTIQEIEFTFYIAGFTENSMVMIRISNIGKFKDGEPVSIIPENLQEKYQKLLQKVTIERNLKKTF